MGASSGALWADRVSLRRSSSSCSAWRKRTLLGAGLSTCVETLPRPISMRSHNKTASKHRIRKRRSWVDVLAARPAMAMLKGLPAGGPVGRRVPDALLSAHAGRKGAEHLRDLYAHGADFD